MKKKHIFGKIFLLIFLVFMTFLFFQNSSAVTLKLECSDYGKKILSEEDYDKIIEICDKEIEEDKKKLAEKQTQSRGIKGEIEKLNRKIKISHAYINQKTAKIKRLNRDINETINDINNLKEELEKINLTLKKLIFQRNQVEGNTAIEALMSKKTLSEFFDDLNTGSFLESRITQRVEKVKKEKEDLERLIIELEERESVERELVDEKKNEAKKIKRNQSYKKELFSILKKEEGGLKVDITTKEKAKQAILRKKFTVASGAKVTFGEAFNIINPYKKQLKMDPAFVLAILFQESGWGGKIGGNIGQCTYNQKNPCGKNKVMSKSQVDSFLEIMRGIGGEPEIQKVSCPICKDGSYGGAMGPAQFMPNTWMGIRSSAAKIIGKTPEKMSPFTNHDAFIASATYLKQQYYSKSCTDYANKYKHISSVRTLRERCAAARYYAGGNWFKYRMSYGESVVKRANRFRNDIAVLES